MAAPEEEIVQGKADIKARVDKGIDFLRARALGFGSEVLQRAGRSPSACCWRPVSWSVKRPRAMKRWADKHQIAVFDQPRFLTIVNVGWDGPQKRAALKAQSKNCARHVWRWRRASNCGWPTPTGGILISIGDGRPTRWGRPPRDPLEGDQHDQASHAWPGWPAARPELSADVEMGPSAQGASTPDASEGDGPSDGITEPNGTDPNGGLFLMPRQRQRDRCHRCRRA